MHRRGVPPSCVRKQPETFCWTLIMRTSRSTWLLSKGMRKSYMKAKTPVLCLCKRSSRFLGGDCLGRPMGLGLVFSWRG